MQALKHDPLKHDPLKHDPLKHDIKSKDKDRFVTILKGWIDQFALSMTNSDTKNYIQQLLIEPFLEYIFQRSLPYAIIAICIVLITFIVVILIFVLLLLNRNKCSSCGK
jgi:hypothetical protein